MPNLIHLAEWLGGGLGLILLGWVLRWGQHRDDCRANIEDEGRYQYNRGWDDNQRRHDERDRQRAERDMAGPTLLTDTQQLPGQQTMTDEEYEVYAASHVISQELAALAAEDVPRPGQEPAVMASNGASESTRQAEMRAEAAGPGHLESTQEWQARMDLEAAQWCARHGLRHESAWAA